ncbi:MAG: SLC13 family permease [Bacteroidales bacterium]
MTPEILTVFFVLISALVLFLTGWIRMDLTALLVMGVLTVTGLISYTEALSGFSNPAVITVWSMFILSAALYQTGVARIISRQLLYLTGSSEIKMIAVIMLTSGFFSGFINNIGVAALMLPVVMDLARSTGKPPSRLLIPLVFGCHLGGFTTLIGTPPNLLISFALENNGYEPLSLFDFTPVGLGAMLGGILFMALVGKKLLPRYDILRKTGTSNNEIPVSYALNQRTFTIKIKPDSYLVGKTLKESRLRAALGVNVLSIKRNNNILLDPGPQTRIQANDKLFVLGKLNDIKTLKNWNIIFPQSENKPYIRELLGRDLKIFEADIPGDSVLQGKNLVEKDFLSKLDIHLISVKTSGNVKRSRLREYRFKESDTLLLQGDSKQLEELQAKGIISGFEKVNKEKLLNEYELQDALFVMEISDDAESFEKAHAENETGNVLGLTIIAVIEKNNAFHIPQPNEKFGPGDQLLIKCNVNDIPIVRGLKDLEINEEDTSTQELESEDIQLTEVVLAPRSGLEGKTLREVDFRSKYGLTVLAIWREGKAYRTNLHNIPLRFGEALLLYGQREKIDKLSIDPDLIVLTESKQRPIRPKKAMISLLIMIGVLLPVILGLLPIAISSVFGVIAMVLTGCIKMEEAYRSVEWRSVFLIAGLLPLGAAMQDTGAAALLTEWAISIFGQLGPWGIISGLYIVTAISALAIPPPALVVIMSPVVLQAAESFSISPHSMMISLAIAAAGTFMSPVSHAANLLVMGPGGYRFIDFLKVGAPLTLFIMIIVLLLLPVFWPL